MAESSLTPLILKALAEQGFDSVATLPLSEAGDERYAEWIARGLHGDLGYLERHAPIKANPAEHFPEFQSLIVVALEYGSSEPPPRDPRLANISRYALGDDYHEVLKSKLFAAADHLRARFPGLVARAFVDTGPLNEKLIAARAGLGFVGKNTNLIDETRGSYFFLGLLLVNQPLERTAPPKKERCGQCQACIPACPTGAIIAPFVLDAARCISYWTIEQRGIIPKAIRRAMGSRIFGCDDCQEVCPWNRFAKKEPPPFFQPREGLRALPLRTILTWTQGDYQRQFKGSAVKRAGFAGFLRNAMVAAGNSGDHSLVPLLLPFLRDPNPVLRAHAADALGQLAATEAQDLLQAALIQEEDLGVRAELEAALTAFIGDSEDLGHGLECPNAL